MVDGLTGELLLAGIVAAVLTSAAAWRFVPGWQALLLGVTKALIPLAYFAWFHNEAWNFADDLVYHRSAGILLRAGYDPLTVLLRREGIEAITSLANGWHIGYTWWNMAAQFCFGQNYWAAVMLNVPLCAVAARLTAGMAAHSGMPPLYCRGLFLWVALHPELTAWSSLINLKDILVMTLAVLMCYSGLRFAETVSLRHAAAFLFCLVCFRFLRFYVPVLFGAAFAVWLAMVHRLNVRVRKVLWRGAAATAAGACIAMLAPGIRSSAMALIDGFGLNLASYYSREFLDASVYGSFRWIMTPQPWSIGDDSSFLLPSSLLHWLLIVPAILAAPHLWRRSRSAALCLLFLAVSCVFYGAFSLQQSPRHRVQVTFAIAWLQFHAAAVLLQIPQVRLTPVQYVLAPCPEAAE